MRRTEHILQVSSILFALFFSVQTFAYLSAQQDSTVQDDQASYAWTNSPLSGAATEVTDAPIGADLVAPTTEADQEELLNYDIVVFPNPNAGKFRLELSGVFADTVEFRIINVTGKKVYSRLLNQQGEFFMDLTSMRKGIYFAQIKLGNKILSHPIVYAYDG